MIGGQGQRVLLKIVAKHADMWNVPNASAERYADLLKVIERHGDTVGRDTDQIEKTIMMGLYVSERRRSAKKRRLVESRQFRARRLNRRGAR